MNKELANILFCIGSVIVILYMVILFLGKNISPTLLGILMFISGLLCAPHTYFAYENDHEDLDVYGVDYGFDLAPPKKDPANLAESSTWNGKENGYRRDYEWNERNLLSRSRDREKTVTYRYGDDGERALKFCLQTNSETLYFNNFYSMQQVAHEPNHEQGLRVSKHIFVGNSRLVTALTHQAGVDTTEQAAKLYYYHADHLQSAQFITDVNGEKYEHIEYTPYGELWIEETAPGVDKLPFRFTGKELDEETGLYYYGARYLDPKYSRWLSGDPAIGEYIPQAPINDEAKKHNENLPGMGGVFNVVNLHLYHYAGNNPVKYVDPDGKFSIGIGLQGHGGAGVAGTIELGVKVAFSWKKGFSVGIYSTESIGSEFGVSTFAGIVLSASLREKEVETGISQALVIGGSSGELIGGGIDVSVDLKTKQIDIGGSKGLKGVSLKIGGCVNPTVGEVHVMYSTTQQISGKDIYKSYIKPKLELIMKEFNKKPDNIKQQIENYHQAQMEHGL